jgi:4-hydroxy-tetrahydrodipicolinate synthase
MLPETTLALAIHPNIWGVKEASGNVSQYAAICRARPHGFYCLSGDDNLVVPGMSFGMEGVISVVAMAFPQTFCKMVDAALAGDFNIAGHCHLDLFTAMDILFAEGNPAGVKAALHARGLCHNVLRLPLLPASQSLYHRIKAETERIK